jgi:NTP pyrophosphatase (non-canonical NTP hydrolase)
MTTIREIQSQIHALARDKGWHEDRDITNPHVVASMLCLIHSEVSEALECVRDGEMGMYFDRVEPPGRELVPMHYITGRLLKPEGFPSELADVVIRCLDLAEAMGIDLQRVISFKHEFNKTRPHRHGNKAL